MADFTPSPCPVLDLGVELEPGDERDPWRRMPLLFQTIKGVFGSGIMNRKGQTRRRVEARIGHYCRCTRETHGACTLRRSRLCQEALTREIQSCAFAPKGEEYAALQGRITSLLRSERHHGDLRATRVNTPELAGKVDGLRMPPVSLRSMPEGE